MRFGFLLTARCNASCAHCTVNSGPMQTAALPQDTVLDLMDQAAVLWRREGLRGEGLEFCLSGGEPFLDFDRLLRIVGHGSRLGATVSCVTNGSWAATDDVARAKLAALKQAGLAALAVSTSSFHQRFVRLARVERALALAREAGLSTGLKCAVTASDRAGIESWARTRAVDQLEVFPVLPYLRDGAVLPERDYIREHALPKGRCPAATITVREDGRAYTCCMPGAFTEFLALGSVHQTSLDDIHDRFYLQNRQQALRHRGPAYFARAVIAAGAGARLRQRYESVCDLCAHIASDSHMAPIALRAADAFAARELQAELDRIEKHRARGRRPARNRAATTQGATDAT